MKHLRLGLTAALLFITPLIAGCVFHHNQVVGSGQRQKEKRQVEAFTQISTEGAYDIEVVSQQEPSLEIEADDNILPLVTLEVSNGVLRIKSKGNFSINTPVKLKIAVANLEGLSASGAGRIKVSGLKNERFEIDSNGATTIEVSGETKALSIEANGAGSIDAHKLRAARADVESNGVAKVEVYASEELNAEVSGPSQVVYSGDPKVNKTVNGPGSVSKKVSEGS